MMTCREFTDKVTEYLEGRVPYGERLGMWLHSTMCVHCRRYLEQMGEVVELLGDLGDEEHARGAPSDVKDDLVREFRREYGDET
jgi:hypothetical protein